MRVVIEIDDLVGYQIFDDDDNVVHFENLTMQEQIYILNSFAQGYNLFKRALKDE